MGMFWREPAAQAATFAALLWLVAFACYITPNIASASLSHSYVFFLSLCALVGFALSFAVFFALCAARQQSAAQGIATGTAAVLAALLAHAAIDTVGYALILRPKIVMGPAAPVSAEVLLFLNNMLMLAPVHITFAIAVLLGFSLRAIGQRERRLAAALAAAQEAQLAALRYQLNPHFLFNSLNALTALVASGRNADAEAVVARLAAFFRSSLEREPTALVMLSEEFDTLASYLDIETVRLGERLNVRIDLPRDLARASVPHFLLQPLAENALKHAVAPSTRRVTVTIVARRESESLVLEVRDDGNGCSLRTGGFGLGLRNVQARLDALYGDEASLEAGPTTSGYTARVRLPLNLHDRRSAA